MTNGWYSGQIVILNFIWKKLNNHPLSASVYSPYQRGLFNRGTVTVTDQKLSSSEANEEFLICYFVTRLQLISDVAVNTDMRTASVPTLCNYDCWEGITLLINLMWQQCFLCWLSFPTRSLSFIKAWVPLALCQCFRLLVVEDIFLVYLGPLVTGHHLNMTTYPSMVAVHVQHFMTIVCHLMIAASSRIMHDMTKLRSSQTSWS